MTSGSMILNVDDAPPSARTYSYSSRPRAVLNRKQPQQRCVNSSEEPFHYDNLMYDRRVVRGNTYAKQIFWTPEPHPVEIQKKREAHKKMLQRKQAREEQEIHVPEDVDVENRTDVQTELYLEELVDRIIEADMECQTDAFVQKPPTPLYIPQKTGADAATQIEEGELFDFDIEVKPMLEVLVGKTLEQALLEVSEEEELSFLRKRQYIFHELHNMELAEMQRLEERERRHRQEKEHRKSKQHGRREKETMVSQKIASQAFALQYLADLIPSVFFSLRDKGFFFDEIQNDIERGFLPYLMDRVMHRMEKMLLGRIMVDCIINKVTKKRLGGNAKKQRSKDSSLHRTAEIQSSQDDRKLSAISRQREAPAQK